MIQTLLNFLLGIPTVHAQVTYSATDANTALSTTVTNLLSFFWANFTGVMGFAIVIGIVITFVVFLARRVGGRKKMR